MKCPHCVVEIHLNWKIGEITFKKSNESTHQEDRGFEEFPQAKTPWIWGATECPACREAIIKIARLDDDRKALLFVNLAYPRFYKRKLIEGSVPESLKADYVEACNVLTVSAKASAALSRRILQAILEAQGYTAGDLAKQVELVLRENDLDKAIPGSIRSTLDAVRKLGNLAAHPTKDASNLQIIDVEPDEAKWCLEIIEALFEHYYGGASDKSKMRVENLETKLARAKNLDRSP